MSKQHYFVIYGERDSDGFIHWSIDADMLLESGPNPVWNADTDQWESIDENKEEDRNMLNDLMDRFADN